jgi:uncharacterized protein (DUF1697 family)
VSVPPARRLALIRGINNIGRSRRVSMADLRVVFESLGFQDVRTLLNSGNVIFSARSRSQADLLAAIEGALVTRLRLALPVILLSGEEVAKVVSDNPMSRVASHPSHLLIVVPRTPKDLRRLAPLSRRRWSPERLALGSRVAYLWCANGLAKSPLRIAVERALGPSGTARNMATFTRIRAALEGASLPPGEETS